MEALDTILFEEGTQVPLNPHTTSSQVSHKDTTVEKALEDEGLRITGLRKIVIRSGDDHDTVQQKVDKFLAADRDSSVMYFSDSREENPGTYVPLTAYKVGESYRFTGYYPDNDAQGTPGFSPVNWYRVIIYLSGGRWAKTVTPGKFLTTGKYQKFTTGEQQEIKTNIDAGSKAIRINYGNATAAAAAIEQFNNDPQKTVILVNYKNIRCVATVSFTTPPFMVAYVPEGTNMRKLLFKDGAWAESVIYHDTVRYNKQTLTEAQKAQARQNINALEDEAGVIDEEHIATGAVTMDKLEQAVQDSLNGAVQGNKLTPVLQEISLSGSDADRKAKFDQFAKDWKALTGASDLTGARFVAKELYNVPEPPRGNILMTYVEGGLVVPGYTGIVIAKDGRVGLTEAYSVHITLEGVISYAKIRDTETFEAFQQFSEGEVPTTYLKITDAESTYETKTNVAETLKDYVKQESLRPVSDLATANAITAIKPYLTPVPFTDTTLSNKTQLEGFLHEAPDAAVMHCTYKEIWAGTLHKINGDWYGLLVKNTNNPADNINVKLSADGTIVTSNSAQ